MKKLSLLLLTILLISVLPYGVNGDTQTSEEWTVILYMGGDTYIGGISEQVEDDLEDIREEGVPQGVNVIALADQKGDNDTKAVEINGNSMEEIPLGHIDGSWSEELNMSSPSVLSNFMDWVFKEYDSKKMMLDLWGHGKSWSGLPLESHDILTIPEIDVALDGHDLDLLGFDACTVSLFETYYQLRDDSDVIIASETEEIIAGWPYGKVIESLKIRLDRSPENFAKKIVNSFVSWGQDKSQVSTSLTAVDTKKLPVEGLEQYVGELRSYIPYYSQQIERARDQTATYDPSPHPADLYHFTERVDENVGSTRLRKAGVDLRRAINRSVISHQYHAVDSEKSVLNSHGLAIYYPEGNVSGGYSELEFSELSWDEWLEDQSSSVDQTNGDLELTINSSNKTEGFSYTLDFDGENLSGSVDIIGDGDILHNYADIQSDETQRDELAVGSYRLEAFLFQDGKLIDHIREPITIDSTFEIRGKISGDREVDISVLNNRTGEWKNTSMDPGDYEIKLEQPGYCLPGDTLKITYDDGHNEKIETISVSDAPVEKDIELGNENRLDDLTLWFIVINAISMSMLAVTYFERKRRTKSL